MVLLLWCLVAYVAGALPTGFIIAKLVKGIDIREHGSGNPGATNVYRIVGPGAGIATFVLDALKGFVPVYFAARSFGPGDAFFAMLVGFAAIMGHMFTVFLRFRGGKGVATAAGVFAALLPLPTLCAFIVFVAVLLVFRYVSLGSIIASAALPAAAVFFREPPLLRVFAAVVGIAVIYKHKSNIRKLLSGTEHRFGSRQPGERGTHE